MTDPAAAPAPIASLPERAQALRPPFLRSAPRFLLPVAIGVAVSFLFQLVVVPVLPTFFEPLAKNIGINIILAVSLNIVNGFTGQFSIGHAGFMMLGGYAAGWVTYYGSFHLWGSAAIFGGFLGAGDWLFVVACLFGGLVAAGAGYVVGLPSLRLRGDYLAIVTLGFGEIMRVLVELTKPLVPASQIPSGSMLGQALHVNGATGFYGLPTYTTVFWVYVFVTVTLVVAYRLKESSYGRAFLSIRENEVAAEAMGINTTRFKVQAFMIAAFFAGIAGGLFAHELGVTLNPGELGFLKSFDIVIMVVLGGMGSVSGAILAAVLLTILPEALRDLAQYRMIFYALALILMMILRPQGLFGVHELWEARALRRFFGGAKRAKRGAAP